MEIILNNGKKPVLLRGADGEYEMCEQKKIKGKDGRIAQVWTPYAWYSSLQSALHRIAEWKISNSNASTLLELQNEVVRVRKEIVATYGTGE